ncbi:DUF2232 domain-containing protein [Synechococcus sp. MIT S1220]|uniref:DUF2232 domain-containing protein n=1 Tax=Synechococcus sp. MIT S1220 TaxID=3082549 RepID=UPI0039AF8D4A
MSLEPAPLSRQQALRLVEGAYLAATTGLIWLALYYLPVGGALFRLALPLPLTLLQLRRGGRAGAEGLLLAVLLLTALMGPVRGPLLLFPYGLLSLWLGWSWCRGLSWWLSWAVGIVLGTGGFLVRLLVLSLLVGENLWVLITRAGAGLLDRLVAVLQLPFSPDLLEIQVMALLLVVLQEVIYVLSLHALAYWIFPRLGSSIPSPPRLLHGLVALDPL